MNGKYFILLIVIVVGFFGVIYILTNNPLTKPQIDFTPQTVRTYTISEKNDTSINVLASTLPQFALKLADQKFKNLWQAQAAERKSAVDANVTSESENKNIIVKTQFDETKKQMVITPRAENKVKPGMYTLKVTVKTIQGKDVTIIQNFSWGVLAINTNKGIYTVGEQAKIGMAVLDESGKTKCVLQNVMVSNSARVWLTIKSPTGKIQQFSTDDKSIKGSKECGDRTVTDIPDFLAQVPLDEAGKYTMHMEAETLNGRRSIDDVFSVQNTAPKFDIERIKFPTRIYPRSDYPVEITVKASEDYSGNVNDFMPSDFKVGAVSNNGTTEDRGTFQTVQWHVDWKKGETHTLGYTIHFPPVVPEFYVIGPLRVGDFEEGRGWQIASDSIFALVQVNHTTAASGTTLAISLGSTPASGHLLVLICARDASSRINTITSWNSRFSVTSAPRVRIFDRIAPVGFTSVSCSFTNNGEISAQLMEFSGVSTAGWFDKASSTHNSNTCNGGSFIETTNTLTPTNPDELLVSAFASTNGSLTASGHKAITGASSTGFADTETNGFSGATSSYDSGWGEAVNNPATVQNDTATFSGAGGTCSSGVVAYNATITISQGSFRFFDNADSTTPGGTLAATNTNITLTSPNKQFRLRMLLDIDAASGSLGLSSGDFILQHAPIPATNNCADLLSTDWIPVATTSAIAYFDNPTPVNIQNIPSIVNDPSDSGTGYTTVLENYMELFTDTDAGNDITNGQNAIANNQAGLWDFSLQDLTDGADHRTYCFAITNPDSSPLSAYRNYPQVTLYRAEVIIRGGTTIKGGTTIF